MSPDDLTSNSSLCDSGFADSLEDLNLRCLECVLEWPSKQEEKLEPAGAGCMCNMQEHTGFEEYVTEIFAHRLSLEEKYHVPRCLSNQPEVPKGSYSQICLLSQGL